MPQFDELPGAMLRVDPEGRIRELNDACRKLGSGFAPGGNLFEWLDPADRAKLESALSSNWQPRPTSLEFEIRLGACRFRVAFASTAGPGNSRIVQVTDITEYRSLSQRLAINEQRYRSLFSQNPDGICSMDREGRIVEANHRAEQITGHGQGELSGHHWDNLVEEESREAARTAFQSAAAGNPCSYHCNIESMDRDRYHVQFTCIPILVDDDVVGVFGVLRDRTEYYRIDESRQLLEACMEQVHDVIIITETEELDEPGPRIVYVNDAVESIGYQPSEVLGRSPRMFQGPDTDREALDRIRRALEAREPVREVLVNYCKDGEPFWNEIEIVPIPAAHPGGRSYFASVQRDITQTKQREAELHRSREELRRLSRAQEEILERGRRRIARDLHDELGQTLTALKLKLGVAVGDLQEQSPGHALRLEELIGFVDDAVEKVREIATTLRPPMLDDLGFEAAAEWFLSECAGRDDLDVQWRSRSSGEGRVQGETATALFRILQECMTNITRHSNASSVTIDYREEGDTACLEVRDDGIGFDPGLVSNAGFGLVGIRERVAMLHGELTVESAIGKGVRIRVDLPLETEGDDQRLYSR